jgi:hypothetical protein
MAREGHDHPNHESRHVHVQTLNRTNLKYRKNAEEKAVTIAPTHRFFVHLQRCDGLCC